MRLFTHNFLQCHVRSCTKDNFPLKIQPEDAEVQIKAAEFNADFLALQMCKIDYQALLNVLNEVKNMHVLLYESNYLSRYFSLILRITDCPRKCLMLLIQMNSSNLFITPSWR